MKKTLISFLALILLTSAAWASAVNYLDTYRPLPYDVNPVDKTMVSYQTAKNFESPTSDFFKGNFLYAYLPYGNFDLRIESLITRNSSPVCRMGALVKTDIASWQIAFESFAPNDTRIIHVEAFWASQMFIWGVGLSHDIESALAYPCIKIGKVFKLDGYDLDTKASFTDIKDGNNEIDLTARLIGKSIPAYIGLTLVKPSGDIQKIVDFGVLFNI